MVLKFVVLLQLNKYDANAHRHEVPPTMRHWSFGLCIDQKGTCTYVVATIFVIVMAARLAE